MYSLAGMSTVVSMLTSKPTPLSSVEPCSLGVELTVLVDRASPEMLGPASYLHVEFRFAYFRATFEL